MRHTSPTWPSSIGVKARASEPAGLTRSALTSARKRASGMRAQIRSPVAVPTAAARASTCMGSRSSHAWTSATEEIDSSSAAVGSSAIATATRTKSTAGDKPNCSRCESAPCAKNGDGEAVGSVAGSVPQPCTGCRRQGFSTDRTIGGLDAFPKRGRLPRPGPGGIRSSVVVRRVAPAG